MDDKAPKKKVLYMVRIKGLNPYITQAGYDLC